MERACLFEANPQSSFPHYPLEDMQGHAVGYYKINSQYKILFFGILHLIYVILASSSVTGTEAKSLYDIFVYVFLIHVALSQLLLILNQNTTKYASNN